MALTNNDPKILETQLKDARDYLEALHQGPEAVISKLVGRDSPDAIKWRLQALLDLNKAADAADLIRSREVDLVWCDVAVGALARNGEFVRARHMIDHVSKVGDRDTSRRCRLAFAEAGLRRLLDGLGQDAPRELVPQEREELLDILGVLDPVVPSAASNEPIETEIESKAVQVALNVNGLLRDREQTERFGRLLTARKPVPMVVAAAALLRWIDAPTNLPQRLREEHPGSFDAGLRAAAVEGECLRKPKPAFQAGLDLIEQADSDDQRERLFGVLLSIAQELGEEAMDKLGENIPVLLDTNPHLRSLFRAIDMMRHGDLDGARSILDEIRDEDDPHWLQVQAIYLGATGDKTTAADYLAKATQRLVHPDLLWKTAAVAHEVGHYDDAVRALEQLVLLKPNDVASLENLIALYMRRYDYSNAVRHLEVLTQLDPENGEYRLSYGNVLALSKQTEKALEVYNSICDKSDAPLRGLVKRAQLLKSIGRPGDAFDSLKDVRAQHWDDAQFLAVFLDVAFAAGEEGAGEEALSRLRVLQAQGKIEPGVLVPMSLDDLLAQNKEYNRKKDLMHEELRRGRVPWLLVEEFLGRVSYSGWFARTQPFSWVFDDPLNRAAHSIYSTNGFSVRGGHKGQPSLELLECPPNGTAITIDLSALITLDRLALLDKAAAYFEKALFPSIFLPNALEEGSRLVLHQGSLRTFYENAENALSLKRISVLDDSGTPGHRSMPYVNEHTMEEDEAEHYYRLRDILAALRENGSVTSSQHNKALTAAHKPAGTDKDHPPLRIAGPVLFELSTLRTLDNVNLLDQVTEAFQVHIARDDQEKVLDNLRAINAQEQVRGWHEALWDAVRKDERFVQAPHVRPPEIELADDLNPKRDVPIASCSVAIREKVPLLADDRACQMATSNERGGERYAAFGTDRFIVALEQSGMITKDEAADAFTTLMGWRYRFIVPPAWVLKTLADRFEDNPPGRPLRDVARYVHDCMRDPGLFAGLEPTEPPTAMGTRLFQEWVQVMVEFVVDVWADDRFSDDAAAKLTQWAMTEFLPSLPRALAPMGQARAGDIIASQMVMGNAIIRVHEIGNAQRGNIALRTIAEALGITAEEYNRVVTGVIDRA